MKERKRQRQRDNASALSWRLTDIYLQLLEKEPEDTTPADMAHMDQLCKQICELEGSGRSGRDKN
ncbi:hypothetical protein [Rahnella sp. ChDrAdgB13]|uniref:hypothetical protein n=1 Tax=Rahnella sp. ChDrAdgB13 TaxID=1850581 RepID=UPI001AD881F7|nr:hypothetical protein [Rahnella sp. ChDrAdgB13]